VPAITFSPAGARARLAAAGLRRITLLVSTDRARGLLARAIAWSGEAATAQNEAFNVTNGDVFTWENIWPAVADALRMKPG
ncbi:hypothetical protein ABTH39_19850, partial [Acinetobacter baumannii]